MLHLPIRMLGLWPAILFAVLVRADEYVAAEPGMPANRCWAVLIGINEYLDPAIPRLQYCVSDARLMARCLTEKCGYASERILLMTDDQTVDDLAAMPATRRAFVRHGVRFADSTVSYPVCCTSRASFLTGRYAHNHGVMGLYLPTGGYARFNDLDALPVWLQRVGYRTVHLGKYMNGYGSDRPAIVPPGWSEWYTAVDPTTYRMWNYTLNVNGELITYGGPGEEPERLYQTDVLRDFALDAIRRAAGDPQPLFMTLSFLAPHHEEGPVRARTGVTVRPARSASANAC